jgi:transcriptional regulator with XRE-family HTH domain
VLLFVQEGYNMTEKEIQRQHLAERLKAYRKVLGLSQKELAVKLGKSQTVISSWEIGTGMPDAIELPSIAKALEVSYSDLIGEIDTSSADTELVDAYHKADAITQKHVRMLLNLSSLEE